MVSDHTSGTIPGLFLRKGIGVEPEHIDALARRAKAGDRDALEGLLAAVRRRTLAICRGVLPHAHDAEDACQEALLKVATKIGGWSEQGRFTTWLHVVAVNSARSTSRRLRNHAVASDARPVEGPDPRTTHTIAETRLALRAALVALEQHHPTYVAPLVLRVVYDLAYDEIAQQLGAPVGTVKARVHHARRFVAPMLTEAG
jgi:RNA polymerase sigma-70 factor, ECF subfamily